MPAGLSADCASAQITQPDAHGELSAIGGDSDRRGQAKLDRPPIAENGIIYNLRVSKKTRDRLGA